mmetsp:Transcript_13686/g.22582  ORF Transcript_13686/g.22582 Transcript_13686/m.22582 type:complete len:282 (+) Transcript_13686:66-911(+)|eukprot:CAMPEP_0184672318 /NCGR_PEP_ID=MMETSP0308-20130426/86031_1 /TAXON_ID=38269 /ORGANISM="Gloeochaete witrockiana, Strain SAG 46.84" /LENGTH=281 /DNA_ID=CAMNT_0027119625 /DNA_START=41 /DNA_END=886 /DNA_ORIENTATION=+
MDTDDYAKSLSILEQIQQEVPESSTYAWHVCDFRANTDREETEILCTSLDDMFRARLDLNGWINSRREHGFADSCPWKSFFECLRNAVMEGNLQILNKSEDSLVLGVQCSLSATIKVSVGFILQRVGGDTRSLLKSIVANLLQSVNSANKRILQEKAQIEERVCEQERAKWQGRLQAEQDVVKRLQDDIRRLQSSTSSSSSSLASASTSAYSLASSWDRARANMLQQSETLSKSSNPSENPSTGNGSAPKPKSTSAAKKPYMQTKKKRVRGALAASDEDYL